MCLRSLRFYTYLPINWFKNWLGSQGSSCESTVIPLYLSCTPWNVLEHIANASIIFLFNTNYYGAEFTMYAIRYTKINWDSKDTMTARQDRLTVCQCHSVLPVYFSTRIQHGLVFRENESRIPIVTQANFTLQLPI